MTTEDLFRTLRLKGVWRCKVVGYSSLKKCGVIDLYVPETSYNKTLILIKELLPVNLYVNVYKMHKPLKHKKYTYTYEIKD